MKKISIKLAIERPNKEGLCSIYVRVTIDRKKRDFPTGKKIPIFFWDSEKKTIKVSSKLANSRMIKASIEKRKNEIESIITKLELAGSPVTFEAIKNKKDSGSDQLFWKYCQENNELRLRSGILQESTFNGYTQVVNRIRNYSPNIKICEITSEWLERFQTHLLSNLTSGSTRIYLKPVHKWLKDAVKKGDLERNPFLRVDLVKPEFGEREFLSLDELNLLDALYWKKYVNKTKGSPKFLCSKLALEVFLLGCYSGLRKSDIETLRWENIKTMPNGLGKYIQLKQKKTRTMVKVPLSSQMIRLVDSLPKKGLLVFPIFTHSITTKQKLSHLMEEIGVTKKITFHCSRHTFATACLTMGMSLEVVSKLCGHSNIATTKIYARLVDERIFEEMAKFDLGRYGKWRKAK